MEIYLQSSTLLIILPYYTLVGQWIQDCKKVVIVVVYHSSYIVYQGLFIILWNLFAIYVYSVNMELRATIYSHGMSSRLPLPSASRLRS